VANVLYDRGQTNEAIANFLETERLNPGWAGIPFHVAKIYADQKRYREAIGEFRKALAISPDWPVALKYHERVAALNNLAWILASNPDPALRNGREAVELAKQACELTAYRVPVLIGTLAAAYAESGDFDLAIRTAVQARDLALAQGAAEVAATNERLLALYRSGKPARGE
jgi:tetratricopeptide (TPR) repeat protein